MQGVGYAHFCQWFDLLKVLLLHGTECNSYAAMEPSQSCVLTEEKVYFTAGIFTWSGAITPLISSSLDKGTGWVSG